MSNELVDSLVSVLPPLVRGKQIGVERPDTVLPLADATPQIGVLIAKSAAGFDQRHDCPLEPIEVEALCGCLAF